MAGFGSTTPFYGKGFTGNNWQGQSEASLKDSIKRNGQLSGYGAGPSLSPDPIPADPMGAPGGAGGSPSPSLAGLTVAASSEAAGGVGGPAGGAGPTGADIVSPTSPTTAMDPMGAGGGTSAGMGTAGDQLSGPTHFRQGIGTRMLPNENSALAGLRKAY